MTPDLSPVQRAEHELRELRAALAALREAHARLEAENARLTNQRIERVSDAAIVDDVRRSEVNNLLAEVDRLKAELATKETEFQRTAEGKRRYFAESCNEKSRAEAAEHREAALRAVADAFVAHYTRGGGCGHCGGLPHSTGCYVGKFAALSGTPEPRT